MDYITQYYYCCDGGVFISVELQLLTGSFFSPQVINLRAGYTQVNMEQWWNDTDRGKLEKNSEKNLSQCHFVHHKFHMDYPGCKPGPPQ
jgi:hypothetical protein